MKLQEAKNIKLGTTSVSKIMLGTTQVWPKQDNDHLLYGEVADASQALPTISLNGTVNTPKLDAATNMFYLDTWSNAAPTSISFGNKENIKSIKKLKGLDTSKVTDMNRMFNGCSLLTSLDLSNFDTSKVTNTNNMFNGCSSLTSFDLSNFNTSKVTDMYAMFASCNSLTSLDLSNFDTSKVTDMSSMFGFCQSLTTLDLSNWDTSNVNSTPGMFAGCSSLTTLDLSNFNTSKVTNMNGAFQDCTSLKAVYITVESTLNKLTNNLTSQGDSYIPSTATIHYNGVDYKWQDNKWTKQSDDNAHVLYGEVVDTSQPLPTISLDNTVNTPKLDTSSNMFYLDNWSNAAPTSISFGNNIINIRSIKKLKGLDTSKVTNMYKMFEGCEQLRSVDLSNFDTSSVTNMKYMFHACFSLTTLDLSSFNISKVTNMYAMFAYCSSLTSLDLSNWDISNGTVKQYMFYACGSLKDVYITVESTLNKLTNNLTSANKNFIPQTATIHYNGVDYKWNGSAWAQQQ